MTIFINSFIITANIYVRIDVSTINFRIIIQCKWIHYTISLNVRLYAPISRYSDLKEINFIMINFKVYGSIILFDESDKLCWKHEMIFFHWWKKVRYIHYYIPASQYKLIENMDIYVCILATRLHWIYIFRFLINLEINCVSCFKLFIREFIISKTDLIRPVKKICLKYIWTVDLYSIKGYILILFFFISTSLLLGLRMSNHNDNKRYRYIDALYSYNNSN